MITYPFSGTDREKIFTSLELIEISCGALKKCFGDFIDLYIDFSIKRKNTRQEMQFLEKKFFREGPSEDEKIQYKKDKESLEKNINHLFPTFSSWEVQIREDLNKENYEIFQEDLFKILQETPIFIKKNCFRLSDLDNFLRLYIGLNDSVVKIALNDCDFIKSYRDWIPLFQPQITVQLPLKNIIFFLFTLFKDERQILQEFLPCFPEGNNLGCLQSDLSPLNFGPINIAPYIQNRDPKKGLLFLHALTLYSLTKLPPNTDFGKFRQDFEENAQVDAKSLLFVVSRRPFSEMWQQIKNDQDSYSLDEISNNLFSTKVNLETFSCFDYGIEFLTETGELYSNVVYGVLAAYP